MAFTAIDEKIPGYAAADTGVPVQGKLCTDGGRLWNVSAAMIMDPAASFHAQQVNNIIVSGEIMVLK